MEAFNLWILSLFFLSRTLAFNGQRRGNSSYFNDLKEELRVEWGQDNRDCLMDLLQVIDGVQNSTLGAVWLWDSLQLPVGVLYGSRYQVGSWAQCASAPPPPHTAHAPPPPPPRYCLTDITLTDIHPWLPRRHVHSVIPYHQTTEEYLNTLSPYKRPLHVVTWGACVPASCTPRAVRSLLVVLLRRSALAAAAPPAALSLPRCRAVAGTRPPPIGYHLFWYAFLILAVVALFFTNMADAEYKTKTSPSVINAIAKAFCIKSNAYTLIMDIRDDIPCLYGIRSITAVLAVLLHSLLFVNAGAVINGLDVEKDIHNFWFILSHPDSGIDTFFFMSGLLTVKGLMSKRDKPDSVAVYLLKRYVRFLGGLAVSVWYVASVMKHMGSGPLWDHFARREQHYCSKHWVLNLLMVNNYFHVDEICHLVTWYVSADYQLTVVGVLLFWTCAHGGCAGRRAAAIFAALALLLPAATTYWYRMPPTFLSDTGVLLNIRQYDVFINTYTRSHYRLGPYMVGMAVGYYFSLYKPVMHREKINKHWSAFLLVTATVTMFFISGLAAVFYTRPYNVFEAAAYCATNRVIWALAVGAIVIICEYGTPNLISRLLCWRAWVPLSRLSYGVYLTHALVIQQSAFSTQAPLTHSIFALAVNGLGAAVVAYIISLGLWLLVEAPLINITYLIFRQTRIPRRTSKEKVEYSVDNTSAEEISEDNGPTDFKSNSIRYRRQS